MEFQNLDGRFASHGQGTAGVTLGAIGTALGGLSVLGGGLGALFGRGGMNGFGGFGGGAYGCNAGANQRYELSMLQELASKDAAIAMLQAEKETDAKLVEVYKTVDARFNRIEQQLNQQAVVNAQLTANVACEQQQIAQLASTLGGLTKTVIPIGNICPEPMARYNSWTEPTTTTTTTA